MDVTKKNEKYLVGNKKDCVPLAVIFNGRMIKLKRERRMRIKNQWKA